MRFGIDTWLVTSRATGIGVYARELARAIAAIDGGNDFFLYGGEPALSATNVVHRPAAHGKAAHYSVRLPLALRRDRVSLFHAVANFLAPLHLPCPLVTTVHDLIPLELPETVSRRHRLLMRLWLPWTLARARRIICVSETTARDLAARFPQVTGKTRVVLNGVRRVDVARADVERVRSKFGLPDRYVFTVSALEPRKNLALLLDVWRCAGDHLPPLVVAGQSWFKGESIAAAFSGDATMVDRVRMLGYVADADASALMRGASLFVFPSLAEGFGMPPVEAMALGVPVVASNAGALPEVLRDGALLLPPRDARAWQRAIGRLLATPDEACALAARGRAVAGRYGLERFARETLTVYREALSDENPV